MTDDEIDRIAHSFVTARTAARPLTDYPGPMPATLDDAYRIQARARALTDAPALGWKLGRIGSPLDAQLGVTRLIGPTYRVVDGANPVMPVIAGGFAAAEAEFLFRIGSLPGLGVDALDHIDAVHVGLEIAGSPFPGINDHGPYVTTSDFGNNVGLVVGPAVADWRDGAFAEWEVACAIDGETIATGRARDVLDGPFQAVRFFFAEAARLGLPLAPGQWISAGAITGVHRVSPTTQVLARFGPALSVDCLITVAGPA